MNKSESIASLAKALVKFQSSVGKIKKDTKNPFFKSDYASLANILDVIQTPLADAGLAFSQFPDGDETLTTILIHAESGEYMEAAFPMHAAKKDPQGIGSAITYARRYALGAILGLNIDKDDDGNAASGHTQQPQQQYAAARTSSLQLPQITPGAFTALIKRVKGGEVEAAAKAREAFILSAEQAQELINEEQKARQGQAA